MRVNHFLVFLTLFSLLSLFACSQKSVQMMGHSRDLKASDTIFTKDSNITIFDENGKVEWRLLLPQSKFEYLHIGREENSQEKISIDQLAIERIDMINNNEIKEQYKNLSIVKNKTIYLSRIIKKRGNIIMLGNVSQGIFVNYECNAVAKEAIGCNLGYYGGGGKISLSAPRGTYYKMAVFENCTTDMIPGLLETHEMVWKFENDICVGLISTVPWDPCCKEEKR